MVDANSSTDKKQHVEKHIIFIQDQELAFNSQDKTLLNCLEKNDVEVHYHCRDGFCGACRVKLVQGKITYPNGDPLAFVGEGEILPCCCIPVSDIRLEIE